ncbi:MAG TPA: recombinase RecT [Polyangia bacterium]|nr:recombinase RecT [Polyangia bacterium]
MAAPNTQVATTEAKVHPIVALFTGASAQQYIAKFLPEGTDLERVAATVLLAIKNDKTKMLGKCTPESLVLGVARIQQWGLELGMTAHLLPFKNNDAGTVEATPVADYKGLAELMISTGAVRFIDPKVVYAGDQFEYRLGTDAHINHIPCAKVKRGAITHAYVLIHLPGGRIVFDVMLAEDIDDIRQKYSKQWKGGPLPSWYAKKTLVRQVSKLIPKNPRYAEAFAKIAQVFEDERTVEIENGDKPVAALRAAVNEDDDDLPAFQDDRDIDDDPRGEDERGHIPPY